MGFWEDASPAVKGSIVVGGLLIAYFLIANLAGLWPYGAVDTDVVQQTRGITATP
jgi:hypothetical protein